MWHEHCEGAIAEYESILLGLRELSKAPGMPSDSRISSQSAQARTIAPSPSRSPSERPGRVDVALGPEPPYALRCALPVH